MAEGEVSLGNILKTKGHYAEAEPLVLQGLNRFRRLLGEEHPSVAYGWGILAHVHYFQGKYAKAEEEA